ncbi:MAG: hypothetical protein HUJ79_01845 [Firmicutes bacterium]|nr:hypothetical protein [Bacillota bacterium]
MKKAYVSRKAGKSLVAYLAEQGYEINTVTEYGIVNQHTSNIDRALGIEEHEDGTMHATRPIHVDPRISTHPDIYMCQLGLWSEAGIFFGDPDKLGLKYPDYSIYNAVCTKNYVLHLLEKTDPDLANAMLTWRQELAYAGREENQETKILGVRQGYTRCMCLPVDNDSFIVSDEGLAIPLEDQGAHVLLISKGHIKLDGFDSGFIGGCGGHIYVNTDGMTNQRAIVFNGDLSVHPDFKAITDFIKSRNILPVWFEDYGLEDIGSILAIE